jgi:hypothetical protein
MNYLTNYYKNLCEQLQYKATKLEHLVESIIDDGGDGLGGPNDMSGRNRVPPGSIPAPKGPRPTVMYPYHGNYNYPKIPDDFPIPYSNVGIPQIDYEDIQREMRQLAGWWQYYEELLRKHNFNIGVVRSIMCMENPGFCWDTEPRMHELVKQFETYLRNKYPWYFKINPQTNEPIYPQGRTIQQIIDDFEKILKKILEDMRERQRNRPKPFGPFSPT